MTHALEPIRIGTVQLKNRIVFPSMCVFFCDAEGYINDVMTEYVRERARAAWGCSSPRAPTARWAQAAQPSPTTAISPDGNVWPTSRTSMAQSSFASSTRRNSRPEGIYH